MQKAKPKPEIDSDNVPYFAVFNSEEGKKVLQDLENRFVNVALYRPGMSQHEVQINVGSHSLIQYIKMRITQNAPD